MKTLIVWSHTKWKSTQQVYRVVNAVNVTISQPVLTKDELRAYLNDDTINVVVDDKRYLFELTTDQVQTVPVPYDTITKAVKDLEPLLVSETEEAIITGCVIYDNTGRRLKEMPPYYLHLERFRPRLQEFIDKERMQ